MSRPFQDQSFPIYDSKRITIGKLNELFKDFDTAYKNLSIKYQDDTNPNFMKNCLGVGILASFDTIDQLRRSITTGRISPTRVGSALNVFHTEIRNTGKKWGLFFDKKTFKPELAAVVDYVEKCELPIFPKGLKCPESISGLTTDQIADYLFTQFLNLSDEIYIRGTDKKLPNTKISTTRRFVDVDEYTMRYEVPMAAVAWGIRHAGMSIKGRSENSSLRSFLHKAIGTADDAGRSMVYLHEWAPDVYKDYNRAIIARALDDHKRWIKTAYAVSVILDRGAKERDAFASILHLINEDASHPDFESAGKAAVLLYVLSERLQSMRDEPSKMGEREHSAMEAEFQRRVGASQSGNSLDQTIIGIKDFAVKLAVIGDKTEKLLEQLKREDGHHLPKHYNDQRGIIFSEQKKELEALFKSDPKLLTFVEAAGAFAHTLKKDNKGIDEDGLRYIDAAVKFCQNHTIQQGGEGHGKKRF